jgi:hypothetical protein
VNRNIVFTFSLLLSSFIFAQNDSILNKKRVIILGTSELTISAGSLIALNSVWYKDYPKSKFHFYNDNKNWLQMDKVGHAYTAYQISAAQKDIWLWTKVKPKTAAIIGASSAWSYQLVLEILDGKSAEWGFSNGDLLSNTLGTGLFLGQELAFNEQKIRFRMGYKASPYATIRPEVLGSNWSERLLKDYNAQSYWIGIRPALFLPENSKFPKWLEIDFGYSIDARIEGDNEFYFNPIDTKTYISKREYALSFDIDWEYLPIKNKTLKKIVKPLNAIKIPFPALYWQGNVCYFGFF